DPGYQGALIPQGDPDLVGSRRDGGETETPGDIADLCLVGAEDQHGGATDAGALRRAEHPFERTRLLCRRAPRTDKKDRAGRDRESAHVRLLPSRPPWPALSP